MIDWSMMPLRRSVLLLIPLLACTTEPEPPSGPVELTIRGSVTDSIGTPLPHVFLLHRLIAEDSTVVELFTQTDSAGNYLASWQLPSEPGIDSHVVRMKRPDCRAIVSSEDLFLRQSLAAIPQDASGGRTVDIRLPVAFDSAQNVRGPTCSVGMDSTTHGLGPLWYLLIFWNDSVQTSGSGGVLFGTWSANFLNATPHYGGSYVGTVIDDTLRLDVSPTGFTAMFCPMMRFQGPVLQGGTWGALQVIGPNCFPQQRIFLFSAGDSLFFPEP